MISELYKSRYQNKDEFSNLVRDVFDNGAICLPNFFDDETYQRLLDYSKSLTDADRYSITFLSGTTAMDIARSEEVLNFFDGIHEARCKMEGITYQPLDPAKQAVALAVKDRFNSRKTPFHFDSSYVNAVFAMKMPPNHSEGHLLLYRNLRNRVKPLFLSRLFARLLRHSKLLRVIFKPKEIVYQERALHVFFGDLSLHGVPDISGGERLTYTLNAHRGEIPSWHKKI